MAGSSASSWRSAPHEGRCFGQSASALHGVTQEKRVAADPWTGRSPALHEPGAGLMFTQKSGLVGLVEPVHDCPRGHCGRPCPQTCRHLCDSSPPSTSVSLTESSPGLQPLGSFFESLAGSAVALATGTEAVATRTGAELAEASASLTARSFGQPTRTEAESHATTSADLCMSGPSNRRTGGDGVSTFRDALTERGTRRWRATGCRKRRPRTGRRCPGTRPPRAGRDGRRSEGSSG